MPKIISASRRTDIPRYYGEWFANRRAAGEARFRNAYGYEGSASLRDDDVIGYLFWTRFARPFDDQLRQLRDEGIPYAFQYTINTYGRELEPGAPDPGETVASFRAVSADLPSPRCIQWRYDPIVISDRYDADFHLRSFGRLAAELEGATEVVNTSIVEPYIKAIRKIDDPGVHYRAVNPKRHKSVAKRYPDLPEVGDQQPLLDALSAIAKEHGMVLRSCANPELKLPRAQCCSAEMFVPHGRAVMERLAKLKKTPSRTACRCIESVDIGMDNTCPSGCAYCYVLTSRESAQRNFEEHDPGCARLR